jgi:hypothetical protein
MNPIYSKNGEVVGWFDSEDILSLDGQYVAFINSDNIISYHGDGHIGWLEDGVFWDSHFLAIGMLRNATASLPRPGFGGTPGQPGKAGRPGRPGIPGTPGRPGRSNRWSDLSWDEWTQDA